MPSVVFRPRVSERTPSKTWFAELATAPGPQVIGETGDNTYQVLFGREWALEWSVEDDHLRLYQESASNPGVWERITADLPPVFDQPLPGTARRVAFCFDQSARIIVAYEDQGIIKVTRWDATLNQYLQNVSFAGVDPSLAMDASWAFRIPDSDVLLFYLTPDRTTVMCRVQRDNYGTGYEVHPYSNPVILDRAVPLPYKYELLLADANGEALPQMLVSSLYPVALPVITHLSGDFTGGAYEQIAFPYAAGLEAVVAGEFVAGALTLPIAQYEPIVAAQLAGEFTTGVLKSVVTTYSPSVGSVVAGEFQSGSLDEIGVRVEPSLGVSLAGEFVGGSYEPV